MRITRTTAAVGASVLAVGVLTASIATVAGATGSHATSGNACSNPVLATNLTGWGSLDGANVSRDTVGDLQGASWAFDTGGHRFYQPQLAVTAGQKWTVAARDRVVYGSGTAQLAVDWYGTSGRYLGEQTGSAVTLPASTLSGGTWTLVSATFTAPAGAVNGHVLQIGNFGAATGTDFKATECDYELTGGGTPTPPPTTPPTNPPTTPPGSSDQASVRYNWGTDNPAESDEYNGTAVDLTKWGLFGAGRGQSSGCSPGYNGHGQRCGSQTTEGGGYLSVTGTADGKTGGLYSVHGGFRYGRVEVRERAAPTQSNGGAEYHAVPLLFPETADYTRAEIDFAERDVAAPTVELFVHHDGTQSECSITTDSTQFHNYAIDWEPNTVTWYVDANKVCTVNASVNYFDSSNGGAQMDMFPDTGTTMRPAREDVDWIHMYPVSGTQYD